MKKKVLRILLAFCCIILPFGFFITSCGQSNKTQTSDKVEITQENISYSGNRSIRYTGEEITLDLTKLTIKDANRRPIDKSYFSFEYSNNINVGDAVLTITCTENNPSLKGSFDYIFNIYKGQTSVETLEDARIALNSGNYSYVDITQSVTIAENSTLIIPEGSGIRIKEHTTLTNYGTITNNNNIIVCASCSLINAGTLTNNGTIGVQNYGALFTGNYSGSGEVSNYGVVYCDGEKVAGLIDEISSNNPGIKGKSHVRIDLATAEISLDGAVDGAIEYQNNSTEVAPSVKVNSIAFVQNIDGNIIFSNNTQPTDNALVRIIANVESTKYFGAREYTFRILKGTAVVSSFSELLQKQATNCFSRYVGSATSSIVVSSDDSFILEEGATLSLGSLAVLGTFTNNGSIEISNNLEIGNSFINNGEVQANRLGCNANSTLTNSENASIEVETYFILNGNLSNAGNLGLNNLQFNNNGLESGVGIVNSGVINISADSISKNLILNNSGTIINSGNFILNSEYKTFINTGTFENNGFIYGFYGNELSGVENVYYRKYLTKNLSEYSSNVEKYAYVCLDETEFFYNHENQIPNVVIQYVENGVQTSSTLYPAINGTNITSLYIFDNSNHSGGRLMDYYICASYLEKFADDALLASAGELRLTLSLSSNNANFALGALDRASGILLDYSIQRVAKTVSNESDLKRLLTDGTGALNQNNFNVLILGANIELTNSNNATLIIRSHCTLSLNGHSLYLKNVSTGSNAYFLNEGKILGTNSSILWLKSPENGAKTTLENSGVIEDVGKILIEAPKSRLTNTVANGITKVNNTVNPKIYAYSGTFYGNTSLGLNNILGGSVGANVNVYIRTSLDELKADGQLTLEYYSTPFVKDSYRRPNIYLNGEIISSSVFSTPVYLNNLNAGNASVSVGITDEFNTLYFGETSFNFTIERIEISIIGLTQDMLSSRNYSKITLSQNINLQSNLSLGDYGLVLDMGIYDFIVPNGSNYSIDCRGNCTLLVSINSTDRWYKYGTVADKMTLICDVARNTNSPNGAIELCYDYMSRSSSGEPNRIFLAHYNMLTIDLNGYSFGNDTTFRFEAESETQEFHLELLSSRAGGSIGCATTDSFAINLADPKSNEGIINISFSNLTIYNCAAYYKPKARVNITATGAIFDGSQNNYYAFKLYSTLSSPQGIQSSSSVVTYQNMLSVDIENVNNVVNGASRPNGIYIGPNTLKN